MSKKKFLTLTALLIVSFIGFGLALGTTNGSKPVVIELELPAHESAPYVHVPIQETAPWNMPPETANHGDMPR